VRLSMTGSWGAELSSSAPFPAASTPLTPGATRQVRKGYG
jgi:hypothetical protein